jgi:excisionase family DNA binding protein
MPETSQDFLTINEVAATLRVSPITIREWLRKGKMTGLKTGKLWRIRKEDLQRFIDANLHQPPTKGNN